MAHSFEDKTFTHLTYCDYCKHLLWGVTKHGVKCKDCNYTCHRKCQGSAPQCAFAQPKHFLDSHPEPKEGSLAENYLRRLSQISGTSSDPSANYKQSIRRKSSLSNQEKESTLDHLIAIITSEKLQDIIAEAATTRQVPINAYLANQAPLNPQITAKNFTRFVSRCRPVFALRDELLLLLSWENPVDTFVSLILYCLLCFYPKMIFFAPQAFLLYLILTNYSNRAKSNVPKKAKPNPPTSDETTGSVNKVKPEDVKKTESATDKNEIPPPTTSFSFNLANIFQPSADASAEYVGNLQNIQNMMGEFSDIYDWMATQSNHLNWTSESETMHALQLILLSTFVLGITLYMVQIHVIFLSLGLTVYGLNTQFSKHVLHELKPYLMQFGQQKAAEWVTWYVDLENKLEKQDELEEISVFENQRWWPKHGYLYEFLKNDRSPWTDFNGSESMPIITDIDAPKGYQWKETSEWTLDTVGPWLDNGLNIGRYLSCLQHICVKPDKNGWIYCDDNWNIAIPQILPENDDGEVQHKCALTRRRRWVRECDKFMLSAIQ